MYLASLVLGGLCLVICLMARPLGRAVGVLDRPDGARKTHDGETPLVGGLAVIVPVAVMAGVLAVTTEYRPFYGTLAVSAVAFLVLGLIDDRSHTRPFYRLGASAALSIGVLVAVPAFEVEFLLFGFYPKLLVLEGWWPLVFTVVCLVGLQNAVNMADGKNGLVIGQSLLWTIFLVFYAPEHLRPLLLVFAVCLCVALAFNLAGRLFLGDSGTYSISIFVGLLAIYCYSVGLDALRAEIIVLWFLVPVTDCLRLIGLRVIGGRSPFSSDRNQLHHILAGWMPWRWGLVAYLGLAGIPGALALALPSLALLWIVLALALYGIVVGISGRQAAQRRVPNRQT
jgi:UDP-GlcNAc:undecaprenyl-phosphate GlcNAc-1-phosphate transferase